MKKRYKIEGKYIKDTEKPINEETILFGSLNELCDLLNEKENIIRDLNKTTYEEILLEFLEYIQKNHTYACLNPQKIIKDFLRNKDEEEL